VINGMTIDDTDNSEDLSSLSESLAMVCRLHLLSTTQQSQLHSFIIQLQSKLTDVLLDSNMSKQRSIHDYFNTAYGN